VAVMDFNWNYTYYMGGEKMEDTRESGQNTSTTTSSTEQHPVEEKEVVEETKKEEVKNEETKEIKEEVKKEQIRDIEKKERKNQIYKELEEIIKSRSDHNLTKDDYARLEKEYDYNYQTIRAYASRIRKKLGVGDPPRTKKETKEVKEETKQEVKEVQEPKEVKNGSTDIANDINKSTPKETKKRRITKVEVKTEQKPVYKQWWFLLVIAGAGLASLYLFRNISQARTIQKRNQELALQHAREAQQAQQAQQVQQPKQMTDWEKLILSNLNK